MLSKYIFNATSVQLIRENPAVSGMNVQCQFGPVRGTRMIKRIFMLDNRMELSVCLTPEIHLRMLNS